MAVHRRRQKTTGPQVVRNNAMRDRLVAIRFGIRRVRRRLDERANKIGVVIVVLTLQKCRDPLQAHPRIDRRFRKFDTLVDRDPLELHEDQVPNFDKPIAVFIRTAWRATRYRRSVIMLEQGPHGPVSPIAQKLSDVGMRIILSLSPAILRHKPAASSSS